jgi:hypothetical protein
MMKMQKVTLTNGGTVGIITDKGTIVIDSNGRASVDTGTYGASYDLFEDDTEVTTQNGMQSAQAQNSLANPCSAFDRQQSYISTLCHVQSVDHNVHEELKEAIEKLKELTYQG